MSMGMDSGWFPTFFDAYFDSAAIETSHLPRIQDGSIGTARANHRRGFVGGYVGAGDGIPESRSRVALWMFAQRCL